MVQDFSAPLRMSDSKSLWITVVEIIDQIHLQQSTYADLISQYKSLSSPDGIVFVLGLMVATLQKNTTLREVLEVHLSIIDRVQKLATPKSTTYRRIILPYFFNYWKRSVEQVSFRFREPQLLANILCHSKELRIEQQSQALLKIIQHTLIM